MKHNEKLINLQNNFKRFIPSFSIWVGRDKLCRGR
jgi:hypothetical protein